MAQECDQFWSEQNGVCSNASGLVMRDDGTPASWAQVLHVFGGGPRYDSPVVTEWLQRNKNLLIMGVGGVLLLALVVGRPRR